MQNPCLQRPGLRPPGSHAVSGRDSLRLAAPVPRSPPSSSPRSSLHPTGPCTPRACQPCSRHGKEQHQRGSDWPVAVTCARRDLPYLRPLPQLRQMEKQSAQASRRTQLGSHLPQTQALRTSPCWREKIQRETGTYHVLGSTDPVWWSQRKACLGTRSDRAGTQAFPPPNTFSLPALLGKHTKCIPRCSSQGGVGGGRAERLGALGLDTELTARVRIFPHTHPEAGNSPRKLHCP